MTGFSVGSDSGLDQAPKKATRRIKSEILFEDRVEVIIEHRDEEYRLRITKSDKLILTK